VISRSQANASGDAAIAAGGDIGSASTTYIGTQVLGVSAIPVAMAARDPRSIFSTVGIDMFTGRDWLVDELDHFMACNPNGYMFVEADAGIGKTAFAAWLVKTRGYLSHFSRYSDGRLVRAALQNLSAQMVREFGLADSAPGGMLPEWAQTPSGFESLLGIAADQARGTARKLVLVVDGLDEAEPKQEGLPFGLPTFLPERCYIIGTYRTGFSFVQPDTSAVTVRISKDDQRNTRDIRDFLRKATAEEVLAARLAEAKMDPVDLVDQLTERCEGVWVYLRYVLQELRIGLRRPDAIRELPAGLWNYYAAQIYRWQRDPTWDKCLLPLLATLGVAGEPVPAAVLARLAGNLDTKAVRRLCDFTFRPLLATIGSAGPNTSLRYDIYHASFREALTAFPDDQLREPADSRSYQFEALADELQQEAMRAHARIADSYLRCFGGLDTGLRLLAENLTIAEMDDGYPLRHLAGHLQHAGRTADLHRLLMVPGSTNNGHETNVWFAAHDAAGCLASYVDDLTRARDVSVDVTNQALATNRLAPTLGTEIRYALMTASVFSQAARISPELLEMLIFAGMWSPERALDHARRITEAYDRYRALMVVLPHASTAERPLIMKEGLAAAYAIPPGTSSYAVLISLVPYMPADQQREALAHALSAAIADQDLQAQALTFVAPHLPADLLAEALAAATAIADDRSRAQALTGLVPHLPAEQRSSVLAQALDAANALTDNYQRAAALTDLVPQMPPDQREGILAQALTAAINSEYFRDQALAALAPNLPADLLTEALSAATAITDAYSRAQALAGLVPYLPADQRTSVLAQALDAAIAVTDQYPRAKALTSLISQLPGDQRTDALGQALSTADAITDDGLHAQALTDLAPHLNADQLSHALTAAASITDDHSCAKLLAGLTPYLNAEQLAQALAAAASISSGYYRARALIDLASHLNTDQLTQALGAANSIAEASSRAEALTSLVSHLPADQRPDLLDKALAAATAIVDEGSCAEALIGLAPHLPEDERAYVLSQALAVASAIIDGDSRTEALTSLALQLPADQKAGLLDQALSAAVTITNSYSQALVLTGLAPHLNNDQLAEALSAATALADRHPSRAEALTGLAPYLPPDLLAQALTAATAITDDRYRAEALTGLAPHLPADQQADALSQALTAATAIFNGLSRIEALGALAPHLPAQLLTQTIAAARDGLFKLSASAFLSNRPVMPSEGAVEMVGLLRSSLKDQDRRFCLDVINLMASTIDKIGGPRAIRECVKSILDVHKWWP
jgi:hypothetical protein